jgi:hypothetical protein
MKNQKVVFNEIHSPYIGSDDQCKPTTKRPFIEIHSLSLSFFFFLSCFFVKCILCVIHISFFFQEKSVHSISLSLSLSLFLSFIYIYIYTLIQIMGSEDNVVRFVIGVFVSLGNTPFYQFENIQLIMLL